jgi:hypothetical protein
MKRIFLLAVLTAPMVLTGGLAAAQNGTKPVKSGAVIRGLTLPGVGIPGDPTGTTCDFSREEVNQAGQMTGASVNCGPDGTTQQNIIGLPLFLNAYCETKAPLKGAARLIQAPIPAKPGSPGNANHCDLSGITPKDATGQFKGAVWR